MAKRANPFIEDFVQQRKIHVGLKQFNNNNERLEKVYKRMLDILFKGAKKAQQDNNKIEVVVNNKKDSLKQLFLAADGTLLHSGEMVKVTASLSCVCGDDTTDKCAYCEAALCARCERPCTRCGHVYCARCSIFEAEGTEVCVSCYG
ncbi:apoptosis regulatory protein Siva-like [Colias croceus]|uniref:apoptosis regulatory protein Siva-like n=1 Tax=Colias crocea TaxID=72248 RepID=UPI001E27CC1F|nr:apoptosis regulatory protein Siva-like [Colias croceus]XP_045506287.1 apoptosis regulatory protein Siva-like [Colias croceus]